MCLLTFVPGGTMPDPDALKYGAMFNDDGHGFAIVDRAGSRIIVDRGMDSNEMIEAFVAKRAQYLDGPALFHSRLTTDGLTTLTNCHPFEIGGDPRTVLAHNGIMPLRPKLGDPRSDTRLVAEVHIPRAYGTLRRRRARLAFERWMGQWNKAVILTVDRRFQGNAFIFNEKEGIWDNGPTGAIWYSNNMYQGFTYPKYVYAWDDGMLAPVRRDEEDMPDMCWSCKGAVNFKIMGECPDCGVCFDCGENPGKCMCYVPTRRLDNEDATTAAFLRSLG